MRNTMSFILGVAAGLAVGVFLTSEERIKLQEKITEQAKRLRQKYENPIKAELQKLFNIFKKKGSEVILEAKEAKEALQPGS